MKATIKWIDGVSFVGESESGHAVVIDGPPSAGGRNIGMRPMELVLVGMGAILLNDVRVGRGSIVGAGAVCAEGMQVPPGMLVLGLPARVIRPLSGEEMARLYNMATEGVKAKLGFHICFGNRFGRTV